MMPAKVVEVWGKYVAQGGSLAHSGRGVLSYLLPYVYLSVRLPISPSRPHYRSTADNIEPILFMIGTAVDLIRNMNPIE